MNDAMQPSPDGDFLAEAIDYGLADCPEVVNWYRHFTQRPRPKRIVDGIDAFLLIRDQPLAGTTFPSHLARLLFGDPRLVYDLRSRLIGERNAMYAVQDAPLHWGVDQQQPARGSLYQFVQRNGPCVIVFDDPQACDPTAMDALANACECGKLGYSDSPRKVAADGCVLLLCLRVQVPSVRELRRPGRFGATLLPARRGSPSKDDFAQVVRTLLPEHFSPRNWSRFGFLLRTFTDLPRRYKKAIKSGQLDEPLLVISDSSAKVWDRSEPVPPPDERDLVPDIRNSIPSERPEKRYDVFISYRYARNRELAKQLVAHLAGRCSVWIDEESLEVDENTPSIKAQLIRELVLAVRASRCSIIFAIGVTKFHLPAGMSEDEALQRGLAMRGPGGDGLMGWNWQWLELQHSDLAFIIDETSKQAYKYVSTPRKYDTLDELWSLVDDFLRSRGLLVEEASIWKSVTRLLKGALAWLTKRKG